MSVSPASAGVSVRRSSPFASTCVRSANATVRCARCSTSRTVTPRSRIAASASKTTSTTLRREPERRLVEQQHVGPRDERARDRELLLLAARERARRAGARNSRDDREELVDPRRAASPAPSARRAGEAEPQVLLDRQLGEDPPALGTSAMPARAIASGARRAASGRRAGSSPADARHDAHDRVQRRRLAGAVRADQADDLALARPRARGRAPPARGRSAPRAPSSSSSAGSGIVARARRSRRGRRRRRRGCARISAGVPSASVRPWSSTWIRSQTSMTAPCCGRSAARPPVVVADASGRPRRTRAPPPRAGRPPARPAARTRLRRERARDAELPLVAVRERPPPARPRRASRPSSSSSSSARRRASRGPAPTPSAATSTFSRTDSAAERPAVLERAREPGAAAAVRRSSAVIVPARELDRPRRSAGRSR